MAALAVVALRLPGRRAWHWDGAVAVLCMTGCAIVAFIPPAYFAGISTTRHMVGTNLATALALLISLALAVSLIYHAVAREPKTAAVPAIPELAQRAGEARQKVVLWRGLGFMSRATAVQKVLGGFLAGLWPRPSAGWCHWW